MFLVNQSLNWLKKQVKAISMVFKWYYPQHLKVFQAFPVAIVPLSAAVSGLQGMRFRPEGRHQNGLGRADTRSCQYCRYLRSSVCNSRDREWERKTLNIKYACDPVIVKDNVHSVQSDEGTSLADGILGHKLDSNFTIDKPEWMSCGAATSNPGSPKLSMLMNPPDLLLYVKGLTKQMGFFSAWFSAL